MSLVVFQVSEQNLKFGIRGSAYRCPVANCIYDKFDGKVTREDLEVWEAGIHIQGIHFDPDTDTAEFINRFDEQGTGYTLEFELDLPEELMRLLPT